MARGTQDVAALEMTKWFDTNYHYIVPELGAGQRLPSTPPSRSPSWRKRWPSVTAGPVLVGPVTYLLVAKPAPGVGGRFRPADLLDGLLPCTRSFWAICGRPGRTGCSWTSPHS